MKNSGVNVFEGVPVGSEEPALLAAFIDGHDFAQGTRRLIVHDVRTFARWFAASNKEPFVVGRITVRDVTDYRSYLREERRQAVSTVNRSLVLLRRFFGWLADQGHIAANSAKAVKELRRQPLAPKGLERSQVRKLLREIELRQDIRTAAIIHLMLYTGCRVSDLVGLELDDLLLGERSGTVVFRSGKGNKQRSVPLPLPARRALEAWLYARPPISTLKVFIGERGPLTDRGVRNLCDRYSAACGFRFSPHVLRHSMAHRFLADSGNDLVSLAQILGHESLTTTARYTKRTDEQLGEAADRISY